MRELVRGMRVVCASLLVMTVVLRPLRTASAQSPSRLDLGGATEVGGEAERYLRVLQLTGDVPSISWTQQPFGLRAEERLGPSGLHPWSERFVLPDSLSHVRWLRPAERVIANSGFPEQEGIGPAWAGRGATLAVQGGMTAAWRHLRLQVAPVAFYAQNTGFDLAPNGQTGDAAFRDARFPLNIDYPQRFGDRPYGRVDLGTSSVDVDLARVAFGASNAPARWGPAREYPLVLGPGAGGFPHLYVGTSTPLDLGLFRLHARLIGGILSQSALSPARPGKSRRYASAGIISVEPRGLDGLEVGFQRMFESTQPLNRRRALLPFSLQKLTGGSASASENEADENQTASAFFRWAVPHAAVEVYGEWYREDYSGSVRRFVLIPEDLSGFTLGLQHVLVSRPALRKVVRFELVNSQLSPSERSIRPFEPQPIYIHSEVVQGHTQRGLLLGSPEAYGGAGWRVAVDSYTPAGRRTIAMERVLRLESLAGRPIVFGDEHPDVIYALRGELLRFAGARDYAFTFVPAMDLNRNLEQRNDRFNLHVAFTIRGW